MSSRENKSAPLWPLLLLLLAFNYLYERPRDGYLPEETAQAYLTRALVDQVSFKITEQTRKLGDNAAKITLEGEHYAAVAPGLAVLGAIPYGAQKLAYSIFGKEPGMDATVRWLRTVLISLPLALFLIWVYLFLVERNLKAHPARFALLAFALCAPVWLAAGTLSASLLASALILACMMLFGDDTNWPSPFIFAIAGVFAAVAVLLYYPAILAVPVLAITAFGRARNPRWVSYFGAPVALAFGLLAAYHYFQFGNPFTLPDGRFWGMNGPSWSGVVAMFVGNEGVFRTTPIMALALLGFLFMLVRGEARESLSCLLISLVFILFGSSEPVDSSAFGYSAVSAALVMWIWPLGRTVEALSAIAGGSLICGVLGVASLLYSALALSTYPFFPDTYSNGLRDVALVLFRDGVFASNLGQRFGLSGGYALVPFVLMLIAIGGATALGGAPRADGALRRVLTVFTLSFAFLWWQLSWSPDTTDRAVRYRDTLAIERALTSTGHADTRLQLRARAIESSAGKDSRDGRIARGQAATADGDNARAIEAYRGLYRK